MAPTFFEQFEGAYLFGLVRLCVTLLDACDTREWLILGTGSFIHAMSKLYFFSVKPSMAELCPFLDSAIVAIEKLCQHDI